MPSRFVTPPDHIKTKENILIINATSDDLTTLVLWLKTVPDSFDIHLYHSQMSDNNWAFDVAETASTILVSQDNIPDLNPEMVKMLDAVKERVVYFGSMTDYPDLIQFFLTKKELV